MLKQLQMPTAKIHSQKWVTGKEKSFSIPFFNISHPNKSYSHFHLTESQFSGTLQMGSSTINTNFLISHTKSQKFTSLKIQDGYALSATKRVWDVLLFQGEEEIILEIFHFSAFERHFLSIYSSTISSKKVCVKEITENIKLFNKSIVYFHVGYCVHS